MLTSYKAGLLLIRNVSTRAVLLAMIIRLVSAAAVAQDSVPSFDCKRAATAGERAVCSSAELSRLDRTLATYYRGAQETLGEGAVCIRQEQRRWMSERNACGSDAGCLKARYQERIVALNGLQPGLSYAEILNPSVPVLVTALPPAPGAKSGPAGQKVVEHRGILVHEMEDMWNMGLAIKSADGKAHAVLFEMDFDSSATHLFLATAMKLTPGATFMAKGHAGEHGAFDVSRCRFVYVLPKK